MLPPAAVSRGLTGGSPDDSTTSSQEQLAGRGQRPGVPGSHVRGIGRPGAGGQPGPLGGNSLGRHGPGTLGGAGGGQLVSITPEMCALQQRLVSAARQVFRFAETARRSTSGFQAFVERADVQGSQDAKLACMHMSVVSLDMGMRCGPQLVQHASRALAHIRQL